MGIFHPSGPAVAGATDMTLDYFNNYIARGLLPKPLVSRPDIRGRGPRQIGYFPEETIARIELIQRLKKEGKSMEEIKLELASTGTHGIAAASDAVPVMAHPASARNRLTLTIDQLPHPAYMVNYNFEVVWFNDQARHAIPGVFTRLAPRTEERSIFHLLLAAGQADLAPSHRQLLSLNLALAKERMEVAAITQPLQGIPAAKIQLIENLYRGAEPVRAGPIVELPLRFARADDGREENYVAYAAYFREGILVILNAVGTDSDELLRLLSRRDMVIRNLLSKRLPVLTELAVLVADLQDSVKICSELPPHEYFELINQIWSSAGEIFRRYYGTYGKHVGDGMVYSRLSNLSDLNSGRYEKLRDIGGMPVTEIVGLAPAEG